MLPETTHRVGGTCILSDERRLHLSRRLRGQGASNGRGVDDRACDRGDSRLALAAVRCRRGAVALVVIIAALGPALEFLPIDALRAVRRRASARLRAAVAAQGDPSGQRRQGQHDEERAFSRSAPRWRAPGPAVASGMDWYVSRSRSRACSSRASRSRSSSITFGSDAGQLGSRPPPQPRRSCSSRSSECSCTRRWPRAREHAEVRRRADAHDVRHLLGGRRSRRGWPGDELALPGLLAFLRARLVAAWSSCRRSGSALEARV